MASSSSSEEEEYVTITEEQAQKYKEVLEGRMEELMSYIAYEEGRKVEQIKRWKEERLAFLDKVQAEVNIKHFQSKKRVEAAGVLSAMLDQDTSEEYEQAIGGVIPQSPTSLSPDVEEYLDQLQKGDTIPAALDISRCSFNPPSSGTFLFQVNLPPGEDGETGIQDLSWTPEGDLLVARWSGKQLWRVRMDHTSLTVTHQELVYEGEKFTSVSCGSDGTWGAVVKGDHIKLHQPGSQSGEVWRPAEVPKPHYILMMEDEMWVSPDHQGPVYVYGRDRVLRRTITVDGNKRTLQCITVSDGRLIATAHYAHLLHILTLRDGSLVTVGGEGKEGGKFNKPVGVATDPTGHILVCDYGNNRVSVFTPTGVFLHQLQLDLGDFTQTWAIDVMARSGKPPLLALGSYGKIRVYELE